MSTPQLTVYHKRVMDFASRISVVCFSASYAISMGAELLRWLADATGSMVSDRFGPGRTGGSYPLFDEPWFIRGTTADRQSVRIPNMRELVHRPGLSLPDPPRPSIERGSICFARQSYFDRCRDAVTPKDAANIDAGASIIITAHGLFFLMGTVVVVVATAVSIMYLVKLSQLRHGQVFGPIRLPSLERLDRMNQVSIYFAWPLLTMGLAIGLMLQKLRLDDPKVVSTLVAWVILTILAHYRYRPEHRGQRVAILTIIAGVAVLVSFLGDPIFGTAHFQRFREGARS